MSLDLSERTSPSTTVGEPAVESGLLRAWAVFVDGLGAAGSVLIGALMVLVCADVLGRNLLNRPIPNVAELSAWSVVVIVFLQLASTVRHDRMARAEIFIDPLARRAPEAGAALNAVFALLGAAACALIAYATWPIIARDIDIGEYIGIEGLATLPTWPFRVLVVLGAGVAALQYLIGAVQALNAARPARTP
ncbi:TRAP transporter small permease subunit [Azospirillum sp. ST 5-10]|uniref:TRAP transporter small permease subunit n=1 Tax=unclassified Azospirillum TaxID=2630922 RepID=UPI003F49B77B